MLSSPLPRRGSRVFSLLTTALVVAVPALSSAQAAKAPTLTPVNMASPSLLADAKLVGHVPSSTVLNVTVSIAPSDRAGLIAFSNAVSDPNSPKYHQFLSPTQVGERFGASTTTVNAVVSYLKAQGFTVSLTAKNRMALILKGKVSAIESAFGTKINNYKVASRPDGGPLTFYSNATVPKAPSTFASKIVTIDGLTNANPPHKRTQLRPIDARNIYNATPLYRDGNYKGEGVNIAVSNFDGYRLSQAALFAQAYGLPLPGGTGTNISKVIVGGVDGESQAEGYEGDLDFQMVLGIAPRCNLIIYDGIGGGLIATLTQEADDDTADIITESYGWRGDDSFFQAAHDQRLSMTAQGITYMCASGDSGTSDLNTNLSTYLNFPYPDFDPDVLMVGGTEATVGSDGGRGSEVGWTGSGSGWYPPVVSFNVLPDYQKGNGVPTNIDKRLVPDIAVHATEWYIFYGGSPVDISGTSAASPSFAGQLGLVLQAFKDQGGADQTPSGRYRLGRIQDFIYPLVSAGSLAFYDVTQMQGGGNAGILPDNSTSTTGVGWDFVTGLGAPNDELLYEAYLATGSVSVKDTTTSAGIYTISGPTLTLGTVAGGDVNSLPSTDGVSYIIQSVKQNGVGQVAAITATVPLQTSKTRRSATMSLSMQIPAKATGYLYLKNASTGTFDLVRTIPGTGSMTSSSVVLDVDANTYIVGSTNGTGGTVTALVRSLQPTRLGTAPFKMSIDQITVTERVGKN